MKNVIWAVVVFLIGSLFSAFSVSAAQNLVAEQPAYYHQADSGFFERIYSLVPGKLKVHMEVHSFIGQPQTVYLEVQVKKENEVVDTKVSEQKTFQPEQQGPSYLAVDIDVPDPGCTLETRLKSEADPSVTIGGPWLFSVEDTVVVPDSGNQMQPLSEKLELSVNGIDVPVRRELIQGFEDQKEGGASRTSEDRFFNVAKFSMSEEGPVVISIKGINGTLIKDPLSVSPKALAIPRFVSRGVGRIVIDRPQTLVVRNWSQTGTEGFEDLIILVTPLQAGEPYPFDAGVTYYDPDQNPCPSDPIFYENQVVYFSQGVHKNVGKLALKSRMKLYLAPGATLEAKIDTSGAEYVTVFGRGILECRKATSTGFEKGIYFENSRHIVVDGIGVRSTFEWQTLFVNCSDVKINDMNLMGVVANNDGIDIDGVDGCSITNNFILSGDDAFGWHGVDYEKIKNETHPFGKPTEKITANNNVIYNVRGGNPIRIGSSMEQEAFRDVSVTDTYVVTTSELAYGIYIDVQDWAAVSDLTIENFYVEELLGPGVIRVEVLEGKYSRSKENKEMPSGLPSSVGGVTNVTLRNIQAPWNGTGKPVLVGGYDEIHTVKGLVLERVLLQNGTMFFTHGAGTAPLTREQIQLLPSTSGDGKTYVTDSDITLN